MGTTEFADRDESTMLPSTSLLENARRDIDSATTQSANPASADLRVGISATGDDPRNAGFEYRLGACAGSPLEIARLECDRHRCTTQRCHTVLATYRFDRDDLCMRAANRARRSPTEDSIATEDHCADAGIRIDATVTPRGGSKRESKHALVSTRLARGR